MMRPGTRDDNPRGDRHSRHWILPTALPHHLGPHRVICAACVTEQVPRSDRRGGWVTGEYAMLPQHYPG
jgi:hypothetical protein